MKVKFTRNVPEYKRVEESEVRNSTIVPTWVTPGRDCEHCKFPLTELHPPEEYAVVSDLKSIGIAWFHPGCWNKITL